MSNDRIKPRVKWSEDKNSYVWRSNGHVLKNKALYRMVAEEIAIVEKKTKDLSDRFINGKIRFFEWQYGMSEIVRKSHVEMLRLGRGGKERVTDEQYLSIARHIKIEQYPRLRIFSEDIKEGKLTPRQIVARSRLYARSSRRSFEYGRLQNNKGYYAKRKLGKCKDHCQPCLFYATLDYLPVSQVTLPTEKCDCGGNCCCTLDIIPPEKRIISLSDRLI